MGEDAVVRVEAVGKLYRLGEFRGGYGRLTDAVAERIRRARVRGTERRAEFWALRDVSFAVKQGETVGIIGHNGAGKSTLLKILSRISTPTVGEIRLRGRVAALLEVGTGFHQELTGRENIYLNGALLGMGKADMTARFEEIISFAEVEQFIDTPVKRYSTGMRLRLAFSVAAHLEPEILIVDEVLSVGDLAFQEKCLGRMNLAAAEGRTVIFVSHNLAAVSSFCQRCMLLSGGRKLVEGSPEQVIDNYTQRVRGQSGRKLTDLKDREGIGKLRFTELLLEADGKVIDSPTTGRTFEFVLRYETVDRRPLRNVSFIVSVVTEFGQTILHLSSHETGTLLREIPGEGEVRCLVPRCPLTAGQYTVNLYADDAGNVLDRVAPAVELTVREGDFFGSGQAQESSNTVMVDHSWSINRTGVGAESRHRPAALPRAATTGDRKS